MTDRQLTVTVDVGNGPKIAKPIWHTVNGEDVPAWELSDGTILLDSELWEALGD